MFAFTKLIILCGFLNGMRCDFFHEPSAIVLKPNGLDNCDFGFSMGFQNGIHPTLVVSAPTDTYIGKVYSCPLNDFENVNCKTVDIDVEKLVPSNRTLINRNQKFYLGASIAATSNYFVTCAPLWIGLVKKFSRDAWPTINHGTCFMYNGTAYDISNSGFPQRYFGGGIGWNTLADEKRILIAKQAYSGDFVYLDKNNPLKTQFTQIKMNFLNTGYGLASGNFYNHGKMYAFSVQERTMNGRIYFLFEVGKQEKLHLKKRTFINNEAIGSMFGYTMSAADINKDGVSDLIVGAPLFREDYDRPEYGAIHIYVGGNSMHTRTNMRTIVGNVESGRFGMAITAGDIDGDEIPEIIVSAPYENSGKGAVYILSGHELKKELFQTQNFMQIQLSQLKMTQKLQKEGFRNFGYSLQVVKDVDGNGFNELAIGSPGNGSVMLYRSLHFINASISLHTKSLQIIGDPTSFKVNVCVHVGYKAKTNVPGSIFGNCYVTGGERDVRMETSSFMIDLSKGEKEVCKEFEAIFTGNPTGTYNFTTAIDIIDEKEKLKNRDFTQSTAVFGPSSEKHKSITITVFCKDDADECLPKLKLAEPQWTGGPVYTVGTSENETISIKVRNDGHSVSTACVVVELQGAAISKAPNCKVKDDGRYECKLITMRKNVEKSLELTLDMTGITNLNRDLDIKFTLYEVCESDKLIAERNFRTEYILDTGAISVTSENHNLDVTETEMAKTETQSFSVNQEYLIKNSGNMRWVYNGLIEIGKTPFSLTANVAITEKDVCTQIYEGEKIIFNCTLNSEKKSSTKVIVGINIPKEDFAKFIADGNKEIKIQSKLSLDLGADNVGSSSESIVRFKNERSLGNNKVLIFVIVTFVALLLLGVICYVLYRRGFFQTENKKKLLEAQETVRRKSFKKSNTSRDTQTPSEEGAANDIEVDMQDCVFEETPAGTSSKDDNKLIQETAQVHCH